MSIKQNNNARKNNCKKEPLNDLFQVSICPIEATSRWCYSSARFELAKRLSSSSQTSKH